jgi:hypothetical protein
MFGISNLAIVPIRLEPSDRSEQVSQLLFGDHFKILEQMDNKWTKIITAFDNYEGWIDNKQFIYINEEQYNSIEDNEVILNGDLIEYISTTNNQLIPIPLGSCVSFIENKTINEFGIFDGLKVSGIKNKSNIITTALMYLNTPYLWGGKTPFGIDCSGFTQMVYKLNGYKILRDASQQCTQGEALSFIEESEPGDLAFFDNEEGNITHVGIMMENNYIIHASGKVRIDRLDHLGIYNAETNRHTHKLRVIKKII